MSIVHSLSCTPDVLLATAYTHVLLQLSYAAENAKQLADDTPLLSCIPAVMRTCAVTLSSPLAPLLLDLLWNVLEPMPAPRCLPGEVRCYRQSCVGFPKLNLKCGLSRERQGTCLLRRHRKMDLGLAPLPSRPPVSSSYLAASFCPHWTAS